MNIDKVLYRKYRNYIDEGYYCMTYEEYANSYKRLLITDEIPNCREFLSIVNIIKERSLRIAHVSEIRTMAHCGYVGCRVPQVVERLNKPLKRIGALC
jgi:hypothetical protein